MIRLGLALLKGSFVYAMETKTGFTYTGGSFIERIEDESESVALVS